MQQEKEKKFKNFINSSLDEFDYYFYLKNEYNKNDLLNLKEYFENLKKLDEKYEKSTSIFRNDISKKCNWINNIYYYSPYDNKTFDIVTKDNRYTAIKYNLESGVFESTVKVYPKIFYLNKKLNKIHEEEKSIDLIQDELKLMSSIGDEIYKGHFLVHSASGNFKLMYRPYFGLYIYMITERYTAMARILKNERKWDNEVYLKDEEIDKISNRIFVKKKITI